MRAVYRLEQAIFPLDAYPQFDLFLLFVIPGIVNIKAVAPDGSFAGFASGTRPFFHDRGWIITFGITPEHQRKGLGTRLLAVCEERIGKPDIRLTVRAGNIPAITLYDKAGYRVISRKPGYYRNGETGLIMEKRRAP